MGRTVLVFLCVCDPLKLKLSLLFIYLFIYLFISHVFKVLYNTNLVVFCLLRERVKEKSGQKRCYFLD